MSAPIIIFFLFVPPTLPQLKPLPTEEKLIRQSLTQCVFTGANRFFEKGKPIFYLLPLTETNLVLSKLTENSDWSLILRNVSSQESENLNLKLPFYILEMRNQVEFEESINILQNYPNWNPLAKFLVVTSVIFDEPNWIATRVLKKLWEAHVIDSVVLLPNQRNQTHFNVYTWYPYHHGTCGTNFTKIEIIDTCTFGTSTNPISWYPEKIPKKFNNCTIKVRMVPWPPYIINVPNESWSNTPSDKNRGIEISLLDLISDKLNVQMLYHYGTFPPNWGDVYPNGSITGNLRYLYSEIDDIAIGAYAKSMLRSIFFQDTFYHYESLTFCVPYQTFTSKSVSEIVDSGALLVTIFLYVVVTLMMLLTSRDEFFHCCLDTFRVLLGLPVARQPVVTRIRFFLAMLMIYSFYIVTVYQTLLASALASVNIKQEISTVKDILDRNFDIYGIKTTSRFFSFDKTTSRTNQQNAAILKKWKNCLNIKKCLDLVAFHRNVAVCAPKLFTEFIINSYRTSNNDPLIYCFEKSVVSYPVTILMRKGFELYRKIDPLIVQIVASGFVQKWERDILATQFENITSVDVGDKENTQVLVFGSLKGIFGIWGFGCAFSCVVFVLEVVYFRWINEILYFVRKK